MSCPDTNTSPTTQPPLLRLGDLASDSAGLALSAASHDLAKLEQELQAVPISECTLTWVDGKLDEESLRLLDTKYNMDPPSSPPPGSSEAP